MLFPAERFAAAAIIILLSVAAPARAVAYAVRVRWQPSPSPTVAGYRVWVRALAGASLPVVDAGVPPPAADGSLAAEVQGLDGRTDYEVSVTAYDAGGESVPSNAIAIGYVRVASRIDSDGDGLTDATEDPNLNRTLDVDETDALRADTDGDGVGDAADECRDTAAGAAVNSEGCSCAQVACDDANPCTTDTCGPTGCEHVAVTDGVSCSNRDACDGAETCHGGLCIAGTLPACDDANACTDDGCDPLLGCTHEPRPACCTSDAACVDQDECSTEWCQAGSCASSPRVCPEPSDGCGTARCEPQSGCVTDLEPDDTPCDDADPCTIEDACRGGVCVGTSTTPTSGPHAVGVRRFLLERSRDGYDLTAIGQFPFPTDPDLTPSGMEVSFEDGAGRTVFAVNLSGAELQPARSGWVLAPSVAAFERLEVRPRSGSVRVSLRGVLPRFELVDATGAPATSAGGILRWRVSLGLACSGALELTCWDNEQGDRRCVD